MNTLAEISDGPGERRLAKTEADQMIQPFLP